MKHNVYYLGMVVEPTPGTILDYIRVHQTATRRTINKFHVMQSAKKLALSTLLFMIENKANQIAREPQACTSSVFEFSGTGYPLKIWVDTTEGTWDVSFVHGKVPKGVGVIQHGLTIKGVKGWTSMDLSDLRNLNSNAAGEYVAAWQSQGRGAKAPEPKEVVSHPGGDSHD